MTDGYRVWAEVLPDLRTFNSTVASGMSTAGVTGAASFGSSFIGGIGKFAAPVISAIAALGIGRLIGQAIGAGINYGLEAVDLAGALGEQQNAVAVQFGDLADEIDALAKSAPKNLNLTQVAFNQLSVRFSDFAKKIAGPGGDVVGVVKELTQRGADFASVYNIGVDEALTLFQSGLAGETEPLRRFGKDLSAAAVEQFALTNGINDGTHELTEAEKVQARYGLLLAQTADVQGDLANTAGSYANQQRQFAVALEEAQTKFGAAILPIATDILSWANTEFLPALEPVLAEVGPQLAQSLRDAMPEIKSLLTEGAQVLPDVIKAGIQSIQGDISTISDTIRVFNGEINAVLQENLDEVEFTPWFAGLLTTFQNNLTELGIEADLYREDDAAKWEEYGNRLAAVTAGTSNDFSALNNSIQAELNDAAANAQLIGMEIPRGMARGMNLTKGEAVAEVRAVAQAVTFNARQVLGIASPSKVFEGIGADVNAGFSAGMTKTTPTWNYDFGGVTGGDAAGSGFPEKVTLVDADGSLLGHMDVRIATADSRDQTKIENRKKVS